MARGLSRGVGASVKERKALVQGFRIQVFPVPVLVVEVSLESGVAVLVSPTEHEAAKKLSRTILIAAIRSASEGAVALEISPAVASSFSFAVKKVGVMPMAPMPLYVLRVLTQALNSWKYL